MKYIWIILILSATAFGQNAYGPDFLNLHCTAPDPNSNTVFGIPPKAGLVPNVSANGNVIIYCDNVSGAIKASFSGGAYTNLFATTAPVAPQQSTEGFLAWGPGAVAANTCVTNTFALRGARATNISTTLVSVGDFVIPAWPVNLPANLVGIMRVSASDTIEIRLCNPTASPTTNPGVSLLFGAKLAR